MKRIYSLVIAFVMLSEVEATKAQTPYVAIPDSNFVHYLKTIVPTAFKGDSLNKSSTLVTTTTHSINAYNAGIYNLSGVQYFTSLTYLDCGFNYITSLPNLPNSLTYLDCHYNNNSLTSLPALPTSLTYLDCLYNPLGSLPALPNSLDTLLCSYNSLTSIPALPNSLRYLDCSYNSLTSLPALPNSLTYLVCFNNLLTTLPALPNSLTALSCYNNNITCFPLLPNSITTSAFDPNPNNCWLNYIAAMSAADLAKPLCAAGNSNGCAVATGIEQFASSNEVSIYPNPANAIINLTISQFDNLKMNSVEIFNMLGESVHHQILKSSNCQIDISDLAEGVYQLIIHPADSRTITKKVIIQR